MNTSPLYDEKELLKLVAAGDELAFARLFHAHHQALGEYLETLTQSADAAKEIVQEAFIKVWQEREKLTALQNFRSWLFIVCRNRAYNLFRDQARAAVKHREWARQQDTVQELPPGKHSPEFLSRIIEEAVSQLPPQQQLAYRLSRTQGLKHEQIARQMQLSRETVKRHISLALKAISDYLRKYYPEALAIFLFYAGNL